MTAFSTGWGPAVGVTFDVNPRIGVQFEYAYRWFQVNDDIDIQAGKFSANHQTHQLAFNMIAKLTKPDSPVTFYITAGPGMYNRKVEITEYEGNGIICDPWYYVCGTYPIESIVGSRGGWDFGFNVGAGVGLPIGEGLQFYIETRYHQVWGPEFVPPAGIAVPNTTTTKKADGQYFPADVRLPILKRQCKTRGRQRGRRRTNLTCCSPEAPAMCRNRHRRPSATFLTPR